MKKILFVLITGWALLASAADAADIEVKIDRNPVALDESFQLIFSASEEPDGEPDFSVLNENFTVLNQQQSSSSSWVNGKSSHKIEWILNVMAKKTGALLIPPVAFGDDHSKPLTMMVVRTANNAPAEAGGDLFLQVEATPEQPLVQSQVIYTQKIYRRVQLAQAQLKEPELQDVLISKLGEDREYRALVKGEDYIVIERKYALFPQKSGKLTIPPQTLIADVLLNNRSGFGGFFSQNTKTQRVSSRALELDVQPIPADFKGSHWLAANALHLEQDWSNSALTLKVGEPLTRTLRLTATGATVGQLPELNTTPALDGLKNYPDQPTLNEQADGNGLTASREEKIAFIASKPGVYQLPAIDISWFNTQTRQLEVAHLPAQTLIAVADSSAAPITAPAAPAATTQSPTAQPAATVCPPATPATATPTADTNQVWFWLAITAISSWLATLGAWGWRARSAVKPALHQPQPRHAAEEDAVKRLKAACEAHDPVAAKEALLCWGKQQFQVTSLGALAPFCEARLRDEILLLNQQLYAKDDQTWHGKKLWQFFAENKARKNLTKPSPAALAPLYKIE